jgi:hypothetical protein
MVQQVKPKLHITVSALLSERTCAPEGVAAVVHFQLTGVSDVYDPSPPKQQYGFASAHRPEHILPKIIALVKHVGIFALFNTVGFKNLMRIALLRSSRHRG